MNQTTSETPRLLLTYRQNIVPTLKKEFKRTNDMAVPVIQKIVINTGITQAQGQAQALKSMAEQLASITGQRPKTTKARLSIASFKLRQGDPIGLMVTLRGRRMYEFLDRLISIVLPRVKDFQGVGRNGFDANGNYNLGLEEQIVFPEINYDTIDKVRGLQITIVTSTQDKQEAFRLLELMGMPFAKAS
jgi:large subunit ribosomal protein L5